MGAPLNRQPNGLLDFFGIKNGGENPVELGRVLLPQLDVLPFYEMAAPSVVGAVSGNLSAGVVLFGPAGATSEPGDTWHFRSVGLQFNTTGATAFAYVRLGVQNGLQFVPMTQVAAGNGAVASIPGVNGLVMRDVYLPPGWALAYEVLGLSAAAVAFTAEWWGYRFNW